MPFRRFFDRGAKDDAQPDRRRRRRPPADDCRARNDGRRRNRSSTARHDDADWRTRAQAVLPTGASTGSKRVEALYGAADAVGPDALRPGRGLPRHRRRRQRIPRLHDGARLGRARIRRAERHARRRRRHRVAATCRALSSVSRSRRRRAIVRRHSVRGQGAVSQDRRRGDGRRRAHRAHVHGARRSSSAADTSAGWTGAPTTPPACPRERAARSRRVPFDDVAALEAAVGDAGTQLAAIVLEPVIERLPSTEWIDAGARAGDVVGRRADLRRDQDGFPPARPAAIRQYADVVPDLAAFGKAMANGYPLAAVVGRPRHHGRRAQDVDLVDARE